MFADALQNRCSYKFCNIDRKTPVNTAKIFKNSFFTETPETASGILAQDFPTMVRLNLMVWSWYLSEDLIMKFYIK